ncbi:hypothetical protein F5X96DRAFT_629048 [Biscogniauxia mediterranea]|nr:hypothetical protein F5X96DRAFT_629048 [Biscogniauxia mediterranea]
MLRCYYLELGIITWILITCFTSTGYDGPRERRVYIDYLPIKVITVVMGGWFLVR